VSTGIAILMFNWEQVQIAQSSRVCITIVMSGWHRL